MDSNPVAGFRPTPNGHQGFGQANKAASGLQPPAAESEAVEFSISEDAEAVMTEATKPQGYMDAPGQRAKAMMADQAVAGAFKNLGQLVSQLARDLYVAPSETGEGEGEGEGDGVAALPPVGEPSETPETGETDGEAAVVTAPEVEVDATAVEDELIETLEGGASAT